MKKELFTASLAAAKKDENATTHVAAFCKCDDKEEAYKIAMNECLKHFPETDGWINHGVSVGIIPREIYS